MTNIDVAQIGGCQMMNPDDVLIKDELARLQAHKTSLQAQLAEHENVIQVQRAHQTLLREKLAEHDKVIHERLAIMQSLREGIQTINKNLASVRGYTKRKKHNGPKKRNRHAGT